jgi:hypothetical protein
MTSVKASPATHSGGDGATWTETGVVLQGIMQRRATDAAAARDAHVMQCMESAA